MPIRSELVKCGKPNCSKLHGPYWYEYWRDPDTKKLKKKFLKSLDSIPRIEKAKYLARKNGLKFKGGEWITYIMNRMREAGIYYFEDEKIDSFLDSELTRLVVQTKLS